MSIRSPDPDANPKTDSEPNTDPNTNPKTDTDPNPLTL